MTEEGAKRKSLTVDFEKEKEAPLWMRTGAFRKLCKWAFDICDSDGTGEIDKTELYAGLLLVHINLAKYAGPAACYVRPKKDLSQTYII